MKKLLAVFLSITIFFAMVSCDREQQEQEPLVQLKATESYRTLLYMPFYVSLSQGFFAERGIDVTLETAWSQETAFSNLVTGNTAVYLGGPEMAFYHFQQGNKVPLSLLSQVSCSSGCYLLARPADKPFSWQDLKGKTVLGYKDGEIPQILFDYLLKKNNLRPLLDVHIIQNLPYELRTGAFLAGGSLHACHEPEAQEQSGKRQ